MNNIRSKKDEVKIQTSCEKTKKTVVARWPH
jgi:hypothetical protein